MSDLNLADSWKQRRENLVKTYKYNGKSYFLFYDKKTGDVQLIRNNGLLTGPTVVFENGGFTEEGTEDSNLYTNGVSFENIQLDIIKDVKNAFDESGGTSDGNVKPGFVENKEGLIKDDDKVEDKSNNWANIDIDVLNWTPDKDILKDFTNWTEILIKRLCDNGPLNYPQDAMYTDRISGFNQDHVRITQFTYRPPRADLFFPKADEDGLGGMTEIISKGVQRGTPLQKYLGMVKLPMPTSVSDSNNVNWGSDTMNNLSAAMTMGVMNNLVGSAAGSAIGSQTPLGPTLGMLIGMLTQANGEDVLNAVTTGDTSLMTNAVEKGKEIIGGPGGALLGSTLTSKVLASAGINVSPEAILARSQGVIPNANMELLFQSPALRSFSYDWKMTPRDEREARIIKNIIRFFKQVMAARKMKRGAGGVSLFLGTPNVFHVQYKTNQDQDMQAVNRIKTCACTGCSVNYTPDGIWSAYEEGQPVSTVMSLRFQELEPVYDTDYDCEIVEGRSWDDTVDTERGDLYPIGDNEVGY